MDASALAESLLSARLHLSPQVAGNRIYFLSDTSGRLSLYSMPLAGGEATRLVPADLALPNPALLEHDSFAVMPRLGRIFISTDHDGDENYQPCFLPIDGGTPEPIWGSRFEGQQVFSFVDRFDHKALLVVEPRTDPMYRTFLADLETLELVSLGESMYGNFPAGRNETWDRLALLDVYTAGDNVLYLWDAAIGERRLLAGVPLDERDGEVPATGFLLGHVRDDAVLLMTTLFEDTGGLCLVDLEGGDPVEVPITGTVHEGVGELTSFAHIDGDRYHLGYNIDGCSFGYEAVFDGSAVTIERVLWGQEKLADGVVQSASRDAESGVWSLAFSTATSPVQLYTIDDGGVHRHTHEVIEGVEAERLSTGEDASYNSHDGTRVSARLYLPSGDADAPYPIIYYIHGGPQSQERPDFTWFSMPLIQLFVLSGFAVFVPNVRGSTGYGQAYMKQVDRDMGGADRLDHVAAVEMLRRDDRLDTARMGVMGRSYGGYMTLTLLALHPDLWAAGADLFGPYDFFTFLEAVPETWKTYFYMSIGHPEHDAELLRERSPRTHLDALAAPLLVIQGRNDPRVVVGESDRLVEELRAKGKDIQYLVFDDEGHDMVKHENKVKAYVSIVEFFETHLR